MRRYGRIFSKKQPVYTKEIQGNLDDTLQKLQSQLLLYKQIRDLAEDIPEDRSIQKMLRDTRAEIRGNIQQLQATGYSVVDLLGKFGAELFKSQVLTAREKIAQEEQRGKIYLTDLFSEDKFVDERAEAPIFESPELQQYGQDIGIKRARTMTSEQIQAHPLYKTLYDMAEGFKRQKVTSLKSEMQQVGKLEYEAVVAQQNLERAGASLEEVKAEVDDAVAAETAATNAVRDAQAALDAAGAGGIAAAREALKEAQEAAKRAAAHARERKNTQKTLEDSVARAAAHQERIAEMQEAAERHAVARGFRAAPEEPRREAPDFDIPEEEEGKAGEEEEAARPRAEEIESPEELRKAEKDLQKFLETKAEKRGRGRPKTTLTDEDIKKLKKIVSGLKPGVSRADLEAIMRGEKIKKSPAREPEEKKDYEPKDIQIGDLNFDTFIGFTNRQQAKDVLDEAIGTLNGQSKYINLQYAKESNTLNALVNNNPKDPLDRFITSKKVPQSVTAEQKMQILAAITMSMYLKLNTEQLPEQALKQAVQFYNMNAGVIFLNVSQKIPQAPISAIQTSEQPSAKQKKKNEGN